jgi:prevent-host-death family protein
MSFVFSEDIKPLSELKKSTRKILDHIHETGRPVVITVNGKPDVVLMDVNSFEKTLKLANLSSLLEEGERDVRLGKTRPAFQFLEEFKDEEEV